MRMWKEKHLSRFKEKSKLTQGDRKQGIDCEDLVPHGGGGGAVSRRLLHPCLGLKSIMQVVKRGRQT